MNEIQYITYDEACNRKKYIANFYFEVIKTICY